MLEHVRRLEVLLRDRVERRDDADEHDGDAAGEECEPVPAGVVGATPASQPQPSLEEEREGDRRDDERQGLEGPRRPDPVGGDAVAVGRGHRSERQRRRPGRHGGDDAPCSHAAQASERPPRRRLPGDGRSL